LRRTDNRRLPKKCCSPIPMNRKTNDDTHRVVFIPTETTSWSVLMSITSFLVSCHMTGISSL
jgi:hypothetical protein